MDGFTEQAAKALWLEERFFKSLAKIMSGLIGGV